MVYVELLEEKLHYKNNYNFSFYDQMNSNNSKNLTIDIFANTSLGIIAGYGQLPEIFVEEVKNIDFFIVSFKKYTNKKLKIFSKKFKILNEWNLSDIISFFKDNNVNKIVFLGYIPHKILLENLTLYDKKTQNFFYNLKTKKAMDIFYSLAKEFEKENILIEPIDKYLNNSFADKGEINGFSLTNEELDNVKFGYEIAKQIANLDIGLTVVVKDKMVIAIEALEGTDECILRAKKLGVKGTVVVKVARDNQDMRFDLPVIGPKTIKVLKLAKANVLAIESGKTLMLDKQKVIKESQKYNIKLYGI